MYRLFAILILLILTSTSCKKEKIDLLEGTWEWVNVENINDAYIYEWNFNNGVLTMQRRLKSNPGAVQITDSGVYIFQASPLKMTLQLVDTRQTIINDKWDVIKLTDSQLIMKLDIVGGVIYREFVK
jgi:hypothetical protein